MKESDEAIVLRVTKFRNTSLIGDVISLDKGLISLVLRGGGSKANRPKAILFSPPNIVQFEAYIKPGNDIHYLSEIKPEYHYKSIHSDMRKAGISMFLNEVMVKTCRESHPQKELYHFLKNSLIELDNNDEIGVIPLYFMRDLSGYLGFKPTFRHGDNTAYFDLLEGEETNRVPPHRHYLESDEKDLFIKFIVEDNYKPRREEKKSLFKLLLHYYALHVPNFKDLKSPKVLRILF